MQDAAEEECVSVRRRLGLGLPLAASDMECEIVQTVLAVSAGISFHANSTKLRDHGQV